MVFFIPSQTHQVMDDDIYINMQTQYSELPPEEETVSLTDFPITPAPNICGISSSSQQAPSEFFEFFTNSENFMPHAEDIVFCGKLTFKENQQQQEKHCKVPRRSESMSDLRTTGNCSLSGNSIPIRASRSLDYKKLNRNSSMSSEAPDMIQRNNSGKFDVWGVKVPKPPRWFVLMFGVVKFPPEMDLRDIKSRQIRRSGSTTMFSSFDGRDAVPVSRSDRKSSCGLLNVLGCQGSASVAVTASFSCLPKV